MIFFRFSDINGDWSYECIKRIDQTNESALDSVKERISDHDHDVPPEPAHLLPMKIKTAGIKREVSYKRY